MANNPWIVRMVTEALAADATPAGVIDDVGEACESYLADLSDDDRLNTASVEGAIGSSERLRRDLAAWLPDGRSPTRVLGAEDLRRIADRLAEFANTTAESGMRADLLATVELCRAAAATAARFPPEHAVRLAAIYLRPPVTAEAGYSDDEERARDAALRELAEMVSAVVEQPA
jgi:hypothetical protein